MSLSDKENVERVFINGEMFPESRLTKYKVGYFYTTDVKQALKELKEEVEQKQIEELGEEQDISGEWSKGYDEGFMNGINLCFWKLKEIFGEELCTQIYQDVPKEEKE